MPSARLRLSLVTLGLAVLASSVVGAADPVARVAPILSKLSATLKKIEAGSYGNVDKVMKIRVTPLIGHMKSEIIAVLGEPQIQCESGGSPWCTQEGDVAYSFYTMCEDCEGGGPELSLSFDESGRCARAQWAISE